MPATKYNGNWNNFFVWCQQNFVQKFSLGSEEISALSNKWDRSGFFDSPTSEYEYWDQTTFNGILHHFPIASVLLLCIFIFIKMVFFYSFKKLRFEVKSLWYFQLFHPEEADIERVKSFEGRAEEWAECQRSWVKHLKNDDRWFLETV